MPWVEQPTSPCGLKGRESPSIPQVPLVVFDLVGLEQRAELLLKGPDAVMFALVANVGPHVRDLRLAHREGPESRLPEELRELRALLAEPVIRALLEMTDDVAQRLGPGEQKEDVRVIRLGVDFDRGAAEAFEGATHVGVEL